MQYQSTATIKSTSFEGVEFTIARMTFGRRIELMRRVRQLSAQMEFEKAGSQVADQIQASLIGAEIDELYLKWGLVTVAGLELDCRELTPEALISHGPEELCREIIAAIKSECSLTDAERKN